MVHIIFVMHLGEGVMELWKFSSYCSPMTSVFHFFFSIYYVLTFVNKYERKKKKGWNIVEYNKTLHTCATSILFMNFFLLSFLNIVSE